MLHSPLVMHLDLSADQLVSALLRLSASQPVCILDSSGVSHLGSHLLIAGVDPVQTIEADGAPSVTLETFDALLASGLAAFFTISYGLGRKIHGFSDFKTGRDSEPDLFMSLFDVLIVHDYDTGKTRLVGNSERFASLSEELYAADSHLDVPNTARSVVISDFSRRDYLRAIEEIKEKIRSGDTYQTNLTHRLSATLPVEMTPERIFENLRSGHPAPFSAFIRRTDSTVISASPERFFRIESGTITTSPIKGTRQRGRTEPEDEELRTELLASVKDRAENTMIVDLLRNDLGRVCEYGSVHVDNLCELEEHPSLYHLVSTISGRMCPGTKHSEVVRALFPCGSITGAPKISTMRIIDEVEHSPRGLSMGAIGYYIPSNTFGIREVLDTSVAIRTMVVRDRTATFNVGGGILIDSDPEKEYEETLTKATALLNAIKGTLESS